MQIEIANCENWELMKIENRKLKIEN